MATAEPCDICAKGVERPEGAIGTMRCKRCHDGELRAVRAACKSRRWPHKRVTKRGREVIQVTCPIGVVHLTDTDDMAFLLADVEGALARAS